MLLTSRPAAAAAPMCAENGASAIAPPTVLPARDVRLESATPNSCDDGPRAPVAAPAPSARQKPSAPSNDAPADAWVRPVTFILTTPTGDRVGAVQLFYSGPAQGHERGVFRPPRALVV
ncbi:MAG TPA: hypothetical protein VGL13_16325 [Polyangiaceae bacterium]